MRTRLGWCMSPVGSLEEVEHGATPTRTRKLKECCCRNGRFRGRGGAVGVPRPLIDTSSDGLSLQPVRQQTYKVPTRYICAKQ